MKKNRTEIFFPSFSSSSSSSEEELSSSLFPLGLNLILGKEKEKISFLFFGILTPTPNEIIKGEEISGEEEGGREIKIEEVSPSQSRERGIDFLLLKNKATGAV